MSADRQAEIVEELHPPLRSFRRGRELSTEEADAGDLIARAERIYGVDIIGVAYVLESDFIRPSIAENMRFAEHEGVISISYVVARRGRKEAADADVVLAVVGQAVSEEEIILFAQTVIEPDAARARSLEYGKCPGRTGEQIVVAAVERERAVRRSGEQRLELLSLRDERRRAGSDQCVDQILLPRSRLQDRRIGHDGRGSRFATGQSFVGSEEKGLGSLDRPAEGESGLVSFKGRILPLRCGKCIARVEPLVAEIVIDVSVKPVRAGLGYDVDDASGGASELRVITAAVDLELSHRLLADGRAHTIARGVIIVDAVNLNAVCATGLTGE